MMGNENFEQRLHTGSSKLERLYKIKQIDARETQRRHAPLGRVAAGCIAGPIDVRRKFRTKK